MGGVIAFEIARRMEQAGADVSLLVLLDAPFAVPAGYVPEEAELASRFVADVTHSLGLDAAGAPDPVAVPPAGQLTWLAGRLSGGSDPAERDAVEARLGRRFGLFAAHNRMLAGYSPAAPRVRAPTLIVSATDSPNALARSHWPDVLSGPVSVMCVDSDHYGFLRAPLVADVGAAIRTWREAGADGR
jgi:thioesterase domain-containing protein